jgi:hypothetical protein
MFATCPWCCQTTCKKTDATACGYVSSRNTLPVVGQVYQRLSYSEYTVDTWALCMSFSSSLLSFSTQIAFYQLLILAPHEWTKVPLVACLSKPCSIFYSPHAFNNRSTQCPSSLSPFLQTLLGVHIFYFLSKSLWP